MQNISLIPADAEPSLVVEETGLAPSRIPPESVAKNSILLFGFQVFTKIFGFISSVLLANYLGTQRFGIYNYAFALTALFIPFCDLGMDIYLMREIPRRSLDEAVHYFGNVVLGKLILMLLVFFSISIAAGNLEKLGSEQFIVILLAGVVTLLRTFWTTFSSALRALNRVKMEALLFSIARILEFVVVAIVVIVKLNLLQLLTFLSIVNVIAVAYTYIVIRKRFLVSQFHSSLSALKTLLYGSLPFALTGIFVAIYFNLDTILVSKIIGKDAAGIYRAAYNLILPLLMITTAIAQAVFPFVSENFKRKKAEVEKIVQRSSTYSLMIALPIAVITTLLADEIVRFLFAPEYAAASTSLMILIWFIPIAYITNLFANVLGAMDEQPYVLKVAIVNTIFNIVANLILIPRYAQNGAAVVTVLTEPLSLSLLMIRFRKYFTNVISMKMSLKIFLACVLIIPFLLLKLNWYLPVTLCVAVIVYLAALFLLRAISINELKYIFLLTRHDNTNR